MMKAYHSDAFEPQWRARARHWLRVTRSSASLWSQPVVRYGFITIGIDFLKIESRSNSEQFPEKEISRLPKFVLKVKWVYFKVFSFVFVFEQQSNNNITKAYHSDALEPQWHSSVSLAQSDALERVTVIIIRFHICFHYHRNRFLENWVLEQFLEKNSRLPKFV